jgi:hypothetical protein
MSLILEDAPRHQAINLDYDRVPLPRCSMPAPGVRRTAPIRTRCRRASQARSSYPGRSGRYVDPVGIKLCGREERDIAHLFNTSPDELNRSAWHDPAKCPRGSYSVGWHTAIGDEMSDAEMVTLARNWDSLCLYA